MASEHTPQPPDTAPPDPSRHADLASAKPVMIDDAGTIALEEALRTSFKIVKSLMAILVVVFLFSGVFIVQPNEVAVRLHFGRPVGVGMEQLLKPGLHWAFPLPIDEIVRIPVGQSHTLVSRTGWYQITPEEEALGRSPPVMPSLRPGVDGYTLTGDDNIIHVKATLKYRLQTNGVINYSFRFGNVTNLLQNLLDNSLVYASARFSAEAALYKDLNAFRDEVTRRLYRHLEDLSLGVVVESVEVQTIAPVAVKADFDLVLTAQQAADTNINRARIDARSLTNSALAQAAGMINDGLTHSNELVKTVTSDARMFEELLPKYQSNPELFKQRLLAETMQRVLTNAQEKFFVPIRSDGKPREVRLLLGREPLKLKETSPK
jgi:membrane protease subunit HflK